MAKNKFKEVYSIDNLNLAWKRINTSTNNLNYKAYYYHYLIIFINFAGLPTHNSPVGTSLVTTLPAPIIAFSPMVMPHNTVHPAPIVAPRFTKVSNV